MLYHDDHKRMGFELHAPQFRGCLLARQCTEFSLLDIRRKLRLSARVSEDPVNGSTGTNRVTLRLK